MVCRNCVFSSLSFSGKIEVAVCIIGVVFFSRKGEISTGPPKMMLRGFFSKSILFCRPVLCFWGYLESEFFFIKAIFL